MTSLDVAAPVNPHLDRLLHALGLDITYTRGLGTALFDADGARYLDFAGAYGALPFGHNPPEIWSAIERMRDSGEPSLVQPSAPRAAAELTRELTRLAGLPHAFLVNSGTEAVEAAIKVVRACTGRRLIVSAENSFHGKTLGSLSATGRARYQLPFGAPAAGFTTVPFGSVAALREVFAARGGEIAAVLLEPVQGEGGIRPAAEGYLTEARRLTSAHGARLILDEVQTGLGRTGTMFAFEHSAVRPDVVTVAKALGGGLVPLGAVLYGADCLTEDFSLRHTSTFGGNSFCARVGLASLARLTAADSALLRHVTTAGRLLGDGLCELAGRHPGLVTAVRGMGLLWGCELTADPGVFARQGLLRSLAHSEGLVGYLCGYLLRQEGIRVAPAYFAARVLRVEPPLTVSAAECEAFLAGLGRGLALIAGGDSRRFLAHLTVAETAHVPPVAEPLAPDPLPPARPRAGERRWAFVGHPTDDHSYARFDPALGLPGSDVRALFARMRQARTADTPAGLLVGACRLRADTGETSYGELYALPYDARELLDLSTADAAALVGRAVAEAASAGAAIVGLGAYTSIVTGNAQLLDRTSVPVTTGNAYTAASALDGIVDLAGELDVDLGQETCVVLGAAGAIGRVLALLLAERVGRLVLAGNPRSGARGERRLAAVAAELPGHLSRSPGHGGFARAAMTRDLAQLLRDGYLSCTISPARALAQSRLVVAATSSPDALIPADLPMPGAIVCDVSQPANTGPGLALQRPDVASFTGGLVRLPGGQELGVDMGLPSGLTYACAAETMIAAHLGPSTRVSVGGQLDVGLVARLREEGRQLGFRVHVDRRGP